MTGLEAVRAHHLAEARARAEALLGEARAKAKELYAQSASEAEALLSRARREGEEAADLDTGREWAGARRRARGIILAAQSDAYRGLRREACAAVRADARYSALLDEFGNSALRRLGPGTQVITDLEGDKGVVASRKNRRISWSLDDIVDEALRKLGPAVKELWQ